MFFTDRPHLRRIVLQKILELQAQGEVITANDVRELIELEIARAKDLGTRYTYDNMAGRTTMPSRADLERIAVNQPDLLNVLVAYFVMEWKSVVMNYPPHGVDQTGKTRVVPDYVTMWGIDEVIWQLAQSPPQRYQNEPGRISRWLDEVS
jgi:hypothetical protein